MASIWKHPNSRFYTACWQRRLPDGSIKKVKRSTKCTNSSKALKMAMEFERAENRANRKLLLESQVESVVSDIVEGVTGREIQFVSVESGFDRWLTIKEVKSEATHATYKGTVERFCQFLGTRSKMRLSLLSIDDVVAFRDAEHATGKVARTVNA